MDDTNSRCRGLQLGFGGLLFSCVVVLVLSYWSVFYQRLPHLLGLVISLPVLIAFLCGGMHLNGTTWRYICKALFQIEAPRDSMAVPCWFMVGFLILWAALLDIGFGLGPFLQPKSGGSSLHRFWELERLGRLDHIGLCTSEWTDFKGSIYFDDGALTQYGEVPQTTAVDISECFSEGDELIHSCHFIAQPVFQCTAATSQLDASDSCSDPRPCAWAVTASIDSVPPPPQLPECGSSGLCGFVVDMKQLMPAMTWNRESMDMFHDVLQEAAKRFAGNLTAQSPLLSLANPEQVIASLGARLPIFLLLLFLFMPFGAFSAILVALCQRGHQSTLHEGQPFVDSSSSSDSSD